MMTMRIRPSHLVVQGLSVQLGEKVVEGWMAESKDRDSSRKSLSRLRIDDKVPQLEECRCAQPNGKLFKPDCGPCTLALW